MAANGKWMIKMYTTSLILQSKMRFRSWIFQDSSRSMSTVTYYESPEIPLKLFDKSKIASNMVVIFTKILVLTLN